MLAQYGTIYHEFEKSIKSPSIKKSIKNVQYFDVLMEAIPPLIFFWPFYSLKTLKKPFGLFRFFSKKLVLEKNKKNLISTNG